MKGKGSVHEATWARLQKAGIASGQVVQGVGDYAASAGTHLARGTSPAGIQFGHCIDLTGRLHKDGNGNPAFSRRILNALVAEGFAPFWRSASSGFTPHWHVVDCAALVDDTGHAPERWPIVERQVADFIADPARTGLSGHAPMAVRFRPTDDGREYLRYVVAGGVRLGHKSGHLLIGLDGKEAEDVPVELVEGRAMIPLAALSHVTRVNVGDLPADVDAIRVRSTYRQQAGKHKHYLTVEKIKS